MSDRIQELIDGIREKSSSLHNQLTDERSKSRTLQTEVEALKQTISSKDDEINELTSKMNELNAKLKAPVEKEVIRAEGTGVSDEQIDELVKEIEYCITQLKK